MNISEYISKAVRPVIYAGHGCTLYRTDFDTLINELQIPVMLSWRAIDLLPDDHPLFAGRPGLIAQPEANKRIMNADLVIILGARIDDSLTCYNVNGFAPRAVKVIVDCDKAELDRLPEDWIKIHKDVGEFMREVYEAIDD
jgi:acetolactate synthase-1/2/3 large subunit